MQISYTYLLCFLLAIMPLIGGSKSTLTHKNEEKNEENKEAIYAQNIRENLMRVKKIKYTLWGGAIGLASCLLVKIFWSLILYWQDEDTTNYDDFDGFQWSLFLKNIAGSLIFIVGFFYGSWTEYPLFELSCYLCAASIGAIVGFLLGKKKALAILETKGLKVI